MTDLTIRTAADAPEVNRPILEGAQRQLGFVPNLYGALANSTLALPAYTQLAETISTNSSLDLTEQQVALIAISIENGCDYCVAAHSTIAAGQRVDETVLEAVRAKSPIASPRLEAVRQTAIALVETRGWLSEDQKQAFFDAGFDSGQLLDLVTLLALKTISNYTNHLSATPLDAAFAPRRYEAAA